LFEQALTKHVKDIANEYKDPEKAKYVAAANRFRIPYVTFFPLLYSSFLHTSTHDSYWDWAENLDLPDYISMEEEVTVKGPNGLKKFPNPLFSYTFKRGLSNWADGFKGINDFEKKELKKVCYLL
jgi:tyrosinase